MSQTQPFWNIYQNAINDYRLKYSKLDKQLRVLLTIFVHQLVHEHEPQLFPHVFSCPGDDAYGFRIGDLRLLFKTEIHDLGTHEERILHLIDLI